MLVHSIPENLLKSSSFASEKNYFFSHFSIVGVVYSHSKHGYKSIRSSPLSEQKNSNYFVLRCIVSSVLSSSSLIQPTVEIVISEQWSWKVEGFLKDHYCPARNHTTLHDHVLLITFSTVIRWGKQGGIFKINIHLNSVESFLYCLCSNIRHHFLII